MPEHDVCEQKRSQFDHALLFLAEWIGDDFRGPLAKDTFRPNAKDNAVLIRAGAQVLADLVRGFGAMVVHHSISPNAQRTRGQLWRLFRARAYFRRRDVAETWRVSLAIGNSDLRFEGHDLGESNCAAHRDRINASQVIDSGWLISAGAMQRGGIDRARIDLREVVQHNRIHGRRRLGQQLFREARGCPGVFLVN